MNSSGKYSLAGLELLGRLAEKGYRIFTYADAVAFAGNVGISRSYLPQILNLLRKSQWIENLKRGVYTFSSRAGFFPIAHDFEIAQALVVPSVISHWTAMSFHHLTQQMPQVIFSITPNGTNIPSKISKKRYRFIQLQPEYFFGFRPFWVTGAQSQITDMERTLLDGLRQPHYCGNIQEVLYAFERSFSEGVDVDKLIEYALRFEAVIQKRLGYVLERLDVSIDRLKPLLENPTEGFNTLDARGQRKGPCNRTWKIVENI